ncbi:MAG: hypothetical protein L0Y57_02415 [Beijerinckiaceae bacterium]|nr:hypothetical protein [Beijerinckiaceae bacterium]
MITGRQALNSIEDAAAKIRADEMRLDSALRSASEEAARLRQERLKELRRLAELKFGLLQSGELIRELDAAEQQAKNLLENIRREISEAETKRQDASGALKAAETLAREKAQDFEQAAAELRRLEEEIAPSVTSDPEWLALKAGAQAANKTSGEAEKKAAQAEASREQKKTPYESDPLFMYLWRRKFGTSDYPSGFFVRFFDAKIAALIGYREARANYAMLNQIPERLRDHANRVSAELEEKRQKLAAFGQQRLVAAGGGPLQKKAVEAKAGLDSSEAQVREARQRLEALSQQYQSLAQRDNNGAFTKAIALMAENDSRDDVRTLYREAARTMTDEDRAIVERIDKLTHAIARAEQDIAGLRGQVSEVAARSAEIDQARREFRRRRYDYPGTSFSNDTTISDVLGGILEGALKGIVLGQVLGQGYHRPPASDWGGGIFPGPSGPPSGDFPGPSIEPPSGGGFRTGGSF